MKWIRCIQNRDNGSNVWTMVILTEIILTLCVLSVSSEVNNPTSDTVGEEISHFPQYSFPNHRHTTKNFRRQLLPHEQKEILTDIQQNHRFQQPLLEARSPTNSHQHPLSILQQHQHLQSNEFSRQQDSFVNSQPQILDSNQQTSFFVQSQLPLQQEPQSFVAQQSPVLLSLQQSPLSSPQFSSLFSQPFSLKTPSLQHSQVPLNASPIPPSQFVTKTSEQSSQPSQTTAQEGTQKSHFLSEDLEHATERADDTESLTDDHGATDTREVSHTDFTIERSISDPAELEKVQLLELKREQERFERNKKVQEEQLKFIKEQQEKRQREREEEDRRDEERRLKHQEELRKIREQKERHRKQQEEQLKKLQEERERQRIEEERLKLAEKDSDKQQSSDLSLLARPTIQESTFGDTNLQPTHSTTIAEQEPNIRKFSQESLQQSRQRAILSEESNSNKGPEELFLQSERQKLYYQLKEAHDQQQKQQVTEEKLSNEEPQRHQRPQLSKHRQIGEKQINNKQLQEQLQKQFQVQLLQRQDLLRQLKLAVSNAATPTHEDHIAQGPIILSPENNSNPPFLANSPNLQVVQNPRQGRPLDDITSRSGEILTGLVSTTTQRPPRALIDELTKGVIPPGADFEVIRHKQDGELEGVGKDLPQNLPQKKVTFVFLEEQADGSYKIKSVKGNKKDSEGGEGSPPDVESIIKKIQEGDLKLPAPSNALPIQQNAKPPLPPSNFPPSKVSEQFVHLSTVNSLQNTVKPNIVKTVSTNVNVQPDSSTVKPKNIIKTVSSSLNFQQHPRMEFLPSVTLPPLYDIDPTSNKVTTTKNQASKENVQLSAQNVNSPYSVEVHPPTSIFSQDSSSVQNPTNPTTTSQYNIRPVTPYHEVSQSTPTPVTTIFPPNKYSPSQISQFTASIPKESSNSREPFLPTDPSFVNQAPSYPLLFSSASVHKQIPKVPEKTVPGIIYANPTQASVITTSQHHVPENIYTKQQSEFQHNIELSSIKSPARSSTPHPPKEVDVLSTLEENSSIEHQTKVEAPSSLTQVLKNEGLFAMARFLRESGLNNILNDTGPYTIFAPTDKAFRALLVQLGGPEKAEEKFKENPRLLSGLLLHHVIPGAFELSSLQDEMTGVSLAGTQLRVNTYSTQDVEWNDVQVVTVNGARISRDKHDISIPQGIAHAIDRVMFPLPVGNIMQTLRSDRERRFTKMLRAIQTSGLAENFTGNKMHTLFAPTDRAFSVIEPDDLEGLLTDREMARALVLRHTSPGTLYSAGMRFYQLRDSMEKGSTITLHKNNGQVKANSANVVTHNIPSTNGVIHAIDGLL